MFFNFLKLFAYNLRDVPFDAYTYEGIIEGSSDFGRLDTASLVGACRTATKKNDSTKLILYLHL